MSKPGKSMKMKNPPHPGFSMRVDCLEPLEERAKKIKVKTFAEVVHA